MGLSCSALWLTDYGPLHGVFDHEFLLVLVGLQAGWGDDARDPLESPLNPHFSQEELSQYSSSTQRNIARLDEDRIDFDLLEELVTYIDQEYGEGAILVFLPGMFPPPPLMLTIKLHPVVKSIFAV